MAYRDLRAFLERLEEERDLLRIKKGVDPRLEASAVLRTLDETEGPAIFFENLRGHEIPALGNLLSNRRRLAWALETEGDFRLAVRERLGRRLKPRMVHNAPVQQVIKKRSINLSSIIPVFTYHEKDSGPYITCGLLMYREPESGRANMGIYRLQIQKKPNELSIQIVSQPLVRYVSEAQARDEAFPVAIVLGSEPGLYLGSVLQSGPGEDKLESIGGLRGKGVEVTEGITVDIPVPAHAEMILEGRVLPKKHVMEGPMGESSGVYTYSQSNVIEVTAVTYRENHIYHALLPWSRDEESLLAVAYTIPMETRLKSHDPAVRMLHLVPGTSATHAVVSIQKAGPGHARDVMALCFGLFSVLKHLVVVDADVNAEDERMVAWAMSSRFQADKDLITFPLASGFAIDPSAEREDGSMLTTKVGFDATISMKNRQKFERIDVGEKARGKAMQILANP